MEKYMGYRAKERESLSRNELPIVEIAGTQFYADVFRHEFKQVDDPWNRFSMGEVPETEGVGTFYYDKDTKNLYLGNHSLSAKHPVSVVIVIVPPLEVLDPVGLGERFGIPYTGQVFPPKVRELKCNKPKAFIRRKKGRSI